MINLNDVIEAIEFENESLKHYYNKETGIIIYVEDEKENKYINREDEEGLEEWEKELYFTLKDFKDNKEKYINLPTVEEIDEEGMMREFLELNEVKKEKTIELSLRKLKDKIEDMRLLSKWYDYREEEEKEIAKKWCLENNIEYQ
ncbi:MAG: hypothetical protein ACRDDY_05485 [Clostridium sp.]|uniref:hypothetical protein n=1 Tax=Clostridium sp. TaxID=1506 RepID=UPI003EE45911